MNEMRKLMEAVERAQGGGITLKDLIKGKVGRVEEASEDDVFVIDGHKYRIGESVDSDVVKFVNKHIDADQSNLILFMEYGYRGYLAYYGAIHVKGKWYGLDIVSEDDVYLLQKEKPRSRRYSSFVGRL